MKRSITPRKENFNNYNKNNIKFSNKNTNYNYYSSSPTINSYSSRATTPSLFNNTNNTNKSNDIRGLIVNSKKINLLLTSSKQRPKSTLINHHHYQQEESEVLAHQTPNMKSNSTPQLVNYKNRKSMLFNNKKN